VRALAAPPRPLAPAGTDLQKVWFDVMSSTSETPAALDRLLAFLDGKENVAGLVLDPERRWGLVTRLSAFGHPKAAAVLEREKLSDRSERAERAAFRARVASPDAASKSEVWVRFKGDAGDRLDLLREGMGAFYWPHQRELLRPFAARFFDEVGAVAAEKDLHFGQAFVMNLFPGLLVECSISSSRGVPRLLPDLPAHVRGLLERRRDRARAQRPRRDGDGARSRRTVVPPRQFSRTDAPAPAETRS
jgi:aminopeptidase N